MSNFTDKAKLLYSVELSLMKVKLRKLRVSGSFLAIAALFFTAFYTFLNLGIFLFVAENMGPLKASLLLAAINLVLFSCFLYISSRNSISEDERLLIGLEEKLLNSMQTDYDVVKAKADDMNNKVKSIEGVIKSGGIGGGLGDLSSLIKLVTLLLKKYQK